MAKYTDHKLVISNNIFDFYNYGRHVCYDGRENSNYSFRGRKQNKIENRKISFLSSKQTLRRIINTNSNIWENNKFIFPKFVTLTFKENVQDIKFANYEFKKFIHRLNYYLCKKKIF